MKISTLRTLAAVAPLWAAAPLALAQSAPAADTPPAATVEPATPVPNAPHPMPEEKNWRFGIGLGYGERTNPLIQSDDIPVIVDLDIAWFGERWFFDNFDLGFALIDNSRFTTN